MNPLWQSRRRVLVSVGIRTLRAHVTREQVEHRVGVDGDAAKPASELVDHDSGRNAGGIDRAA